MSDGEGLWEMLPCGCGVCTTFIDGEPVFMIEPCALDCKHYLYVLEEAAQQNKPVTKVDLR